MSLVLDHVSYKYSTGTAYEIKALDDVSLTIEDGEFVGILYTLILVILTLANVNMGQNMHANAVMGLQYFFQITVLLQFGYAFVLVQLLLGDLYTPRLCFAIHALPVTRGGWFGTQVIQGILTAIPGILLSGAPNCKQSGSEGYC